MQEQSTDITPKGENIITLEDMEEKKKYSQKVAAQHNIQTYQNQRELKVQNFSVLNLICKFHEMKSHIYAS